MDRKILFITLSNIGDVILTLPALEALINSYPGSAVTVIGSARVRDLFEDNPLVHRFIVYDKKESLRNKIKLFLSLFKERFDLVVDLKDSFLGALLKARAGNFGFKKVPSSLRHMRDIHLALSGYPKESTPTPSFLYIKPQEKERVELLLKDAGIRESDTIVAIAAGSRSHTKRWPKERFADLCCDLMKRPGLKIVLLGDAEDAFINKYIGGALEGKCLDLSNKTNLRELAFLLRRCSLLISNDSAILHMGSYVNIPVIGIFGITDTKKYGPWSKVNVAVTKEISCRPCEKAQCRFGNLKCILSIKKEDVLKSAEDILDKVLNKVAPRDYKRILVIRTDRIGDVLLSTPVIRELRANYPNAFIGVMVSPYCRDILDGNPDVDEVIVYDKEIKHKSLVGNLRFVRKLRKYKFDLAIILHPTNRVHLLSYLAGIPQRAGFDRKMGFLLNRRIPHTKERGEKHESEYGLDLLKSLNMSVGSPVLFMPLKKESEEWVKEYFKVNGIKQDDKLLAINPGSSCPSKIWPLENFSKIADLLSEEYGFRVIITGGAKELPLAEKVASGMRSKALVLAGKTSVSQLASIIKRCTIFISNDSGPVHIACALRIPVISIFGRKQPGLSPKRWGPLAANSRILHKDAGCVECFAHKCRVDFACLKKITVDDVLSCAHEILKA